MKKIDLNIDDLSILDNLYSSNSKLVVNFKDREDSFLKHRYKMYIAYANKHKLSSLAPTQNFHKKRAEIFEKLYSPGLAPVKYIKKYRTKTNFHICSLCGSPASGTLDHFLPQNLYPEFSIFSKNLIPACKCNSSKSKNIILMYHPQFFDLLSVRIYFIKFKITQGVVNDLIFTSTLNHKHKYYDLVTSHLKNHILICSKGIEDFMRTKLQSIYDTPHVYLSALKYIKITSKKQLRKIILDQIENENIKYESVNSWDSMALCSYLSKNVFCTLYDKIIKMQTSI